MGRGIRCGKWRGQAYRCACLEVEASDPRTIVHCVESGDFVHAHRRHLQSARYFVHDAEAREAELALSEVEQRHDGSFLVLRRIPLEDFRDELLTDLVELERY